MAFVIGTPSRSSYGSFSKMVGSLGKSPIGSPHMFNQYMQSMELNNMKTYAPSSLAGVKPSTVEQNLLDPTFVKRKSKMDMLHLATPAAQQMRLKLIAGSVIVFLNSGYKGKRFIYEKARDLGVVAIIIDNHGSWSEKLVEDGVIKKFIGVDMNAPDIEAQIVSIINGLDDEGLSVDGVTTFWETAVPLAARVAETLGLPGNPPDAIEAAKNKHQTRARMSKGKLPTPRNYLISSDEELKAAADTVGFPAVLKPIEGLLSIGVVRVESEIHLRKVFQDVTEQMEGMYMTRDGGMASIKSGEKLPAGAHALKTKLMLEEYLDGIEVDVDIVLTAGEPVYCKVTDNWPTLEPWFNETGDNSPSILPDDHQRELEALCVGSLKCLGFKCGVFHAEAKYTTRGPRLIEINSRMGGGQVRENNLAVWGVDLVDESLMTAIGLPCHPPVPSGAYTCRSALYFNSKQTGIMGPADWLANVRKLPNVVYARLLVGDGDEVMCAEDGLPTWLGQIMCEGETPQEAIDWVVKYEQLVDPDIIPQGGEVALRCLLPIDFSREDMGFLKAPTQDAQDYRLSLLRDRVVVFISAGYAGKKFIFERAKAHGLMSIIIDNPGSWSEALEADGTIKKFIPIDLNANLDQVVSQIVAALKKLPREGLPPSGVMTFWETAVPLAARVAEGLGCVSNTSKAIDAAKNKHETRRMMSEAGLPTPRNFLIKSVDQLPAAAKTVGFPAVLKPTVGLLSIGVVRVNSEEHLLDTYKETEAVMADTFLTKDGAMGKLSDCHGVLPRGASPLNCAMMLEEYLDGTEIDCDVVMSGGEAVYSKITDNWPTMEPWFNETGDNVPSLLPTEQVADLEALCVQTLKCLGFQTGVFHVEAKYTTRGPRLIEVNSRMGGGQVHENNKAVWGTDLVDESLLASIGIPNAPPAPKKPLTCRSALYFNAPRSGVMGPGDWLKEVRSKPGVVYAKLLVKEGEFVQCATEGLPTWLGQIMCDAPTPEEAMALVKAYEEEIVAPILDKPAKAKAIVVPIPAVVAPKSDGFTPTGSPAATSSIKKPVSKSSGGGLSAAFGSKTNISEAKKGAEPKMDNSWGN